MKRIRKIMALVLCFMCVLSTFAYAGDADSTVVELGQDMQALHAVVGQDTISRKAFISVESGLNINREAVMRYTYEDNLVIEVSEETGMLYSISDFDPIVVGETKINSEKDLAVEIENLSNLSKMNSSYELVESIAFDEDYWQLTWSKREENGVLNPYNGADAFYNRYTKEIIAYIRFNTEPNTTKNVAISNTDALKIVNNNVKAVELFGIDSKNALDVNINLTYVKYRPLSKEKIEVNANDIRLAYEFTNDKGVCLCVDAITGEIIEISATRATRAQAFSIDNDPAFPYPYTQTADARNCFDELGYTTYFSYVADDYTVKDEVLEFLGESDAYGFYLACHGSQSALSNNKDWIIEPSDISGNWRFVFLDACDSAAGTAWSNAFSITDSSTDRAFLGWSDTVNGYDASDFTGLFFSEVIDGDHSNNIRDAAVWAAAQIPGSGTTPIKFYGDDTYNGEI